MIVSKFIVKKYAPRDKDSEHLRGMLDHLAVRKGERMKEKSQGKNEHEQENGNRIDNQGNIQ